MALLTDEQPAVGVLYGWHLTTPWCYLGYGVLASVLTRCILSALKAYDAGQPEEFRKAFGKAFLNRVTPGSPPNWSSGILGMAELLAYPVLLVTGELTAIGFWIALKTAGEWQGWKESRADFLRFLIGNVIVLAFSVFAAYKFVRK